MAHFSAVALLRPLILLPRRVLQFLRHGVDRLLHARRRRSALSRLRDRGKPGSALFVCLGNINRSPFAAGAYAHGLRERGAETVCVRSAGFIGPGRSSPPQTQQCAGRYGFGLADHRSRLVDAGEAGLTDLVVVMSPKQRRTICRMTGRRREEVVVLGDLDPHPIIRRAIQDPYGHDDEVFARVYERVQRCVDSLLDATAPTTEAETPLSSPAP